MKKQEYQGLYDTPDGRKAWFSITEEIYQSFIKGEKVLCQAVRIEPDDFDFSKVEIPIEKKQLDLSEKKQIPAI